MLLLRTALVAPQMERRARLRKLLAAMDEDEKVEKLGRSPPPLVHSSLLEQIVVIYPRHLPSAHAHQKPLCIQQGS